MSMIIFGLSKAEIISSSPDAEPELSGSKESNFKLNDKICEQRI